MKGLSWTRVTQDRGKWWTIVKTVMNIQLYRRWTFLSFYVTISFWKIVLLHGIMP